ncbi:MAG: HEPN domain-containing protein, partial [Sulfolobales archaeon]
MHLIYDLTQLIIDRHYSISGDYWALLWKRARRFLSRVERDYQENDYDGACFNSEQVIQLATKATLHKLFGEKTRVHGSKTHLAHLRNLLYEAGKEDLAVQLDDLIIESLQIEEGLRSLKRAISRVDMVN